MSADLGADALAKLRAPFGLDEIELLPKYTGEKVDNKIPRDAYRQCAECGGYHPFPCAHLSYVGHAGVTTRLLDVDPLWNWEPVAVNEDGTPKLTAAGGQHGMWIRLTVLGITRLGFGDAGGKKEVSGSAIKEIIGDAIRNGAMRFGVGTYLWSKSDAAKVELVRGGEDPDAPSEPTPPAKSATPATAPGKLTEGQLKAVYAIAHALGWADEYLHASLKRSLGVDHVGDLTKDQASTLIEALKVKQAAKTPAPTPDPEPEPETPFDAEDIPF